MRTLTLEPCHEPGGEITIPGSKSISNRALLLASEASGVTRISNLLDSDDVQLMLRALETLGIPLQKTADGCSVTGRAGPLVTQPVALELNLGLAGTALRPLLAALTLGPGSFLLDGTARMRERPISPLVDGLRQLGARIEYAQAEGYPPVQIEGSGLQGGKVTMAGHLSSQFLTSLLMAAPLAAGPVEIEIAGEQISKPYLGITLDLMARFGVRVEHEDFQRFRVTPAAYRSPGSLLVEGDASSASYFLAAGAIAGTGVRVRGIGKDSVQGDIAFLEVLRKMGANVAADNASILVAPGALRGLDVDLNAIPDAAMTVAVLALFARGSTTIRNIYSWRVKETDRLAAMATELRKLGATVIEGRDFISITPPETFVAARIATYGDHRMAMCFSLACLGGVPVTIEDPDCVAKTFPTYFDLFDSLRVAG